jgi:hypothetical protein
MHLIARGSQGISKGGAGFQGGEGRWGIGPACQSMALLEVLLQSDVTRSARFDLGRPNAAVD